MDVSKQDYQQPDMAEKTTSGIVFKQDEKDGSGLAFVSGGGLHECAVYDDADSTIGIMARCKAVGNEMTTKSG